MYMYKAYQRGVFLIIQYFFTKIIENGTKVIDRIIHRVARHRLVPLYPSVILEIIEFLGLSESCRSFEAFRRPTRQLRQTPPFLAPLRTADDRCRAMAPPAP